MKTQQPFKRLISLILALFMVVGLMPVNAHAAEPGEVVDAAIIFSDLHTSKSDYKESTVKAFFTTLKNTGLPISLVVSAGDAFSVNEDSGKYTGDTTKITGYIHSALGDSSIPVHYVWSDHDRYGTGIDKNSGFVYGAGADGIYGNADDDNYYVYSLSMADLSTNDRYKAGFHSNAAITATIAAFVADAAELDQSKPLLITSHQPLFDRRDDNGHALEWCTAINQVAENMDVAFFFGHNHRYDKTEDYFYAKGSTMPVTTTSLSSQNVKLNFTHMCAGYMAPDSTGSTSSTTRSGVLMAVQIYEDSIRYTTYNKSGIYTGSYAVDRTVTRDHAVSEPELVVSGTDAYFVGEELDLTVSCKTGSRVEDVTASAEITGFDLNTAGDYELTVSYDGLTARFPIQVRQKLFVDDATGVAVEVQVPGATGLTVSGVGSDVIERTEGMLSSAVGCDISLTGFGEGTAIVTLPIPSGVDKPAVCHVAEDGTVSRIQIQVSGNEASFTTDSFGIFLIGQEELTEELQNTVIGGTTVYEEKTVYVKADAFVNGGKYLIVGEDKPTNGNKIAYLNNNGSEGWVVVTPNAEDQIELDHAGAIWTATSSSSGYILSNNNRYIGGTDANTLKSSSYQAVKVTYDAAKARLKTASGTTRYLYYSTSGSENWKWATTSSSSSSSRNMWIYKEETVCVTISTPVTYVLEAQALHHVLATDSAALHFELLADGQAAELPSGAAYRFEIKNDRSGIIESISDEGVITFTGEIGSCYVKICCDLDEGTVYKYVKISTEADPNACDHSYTADLREPTCTADGLITYVCACGDSYTEVLPALGHSYEAVVTAPTCTEAGFTTHTCANCGDRYVTDETAPLGHVYEPVTTEPTCTEDGSVVYTCACGDTYTEVIPALGHSYEAVVTAPTCTEAGFTTYTCRCGAYYIADETAPLGHSYTAATTEATCTENGSVVYTCVCGDCYTEVLPALGHSYETVVTAPTCTEAGFTTHTCANCGDSCITDETPAQGHSYTSVKTEATCTTDGSVVHTCHCGERYVSDVVPALGHELESVKTEATCTEAGFTTHTCRRCGEVTVDSHVAALGHDLKVTEQAATCTADGFLTETCDRCGESHTEVLPALGHTYETVITEASCTESGSIVCTCACGDSFTEVIPALGHSYEAVVTAPTCTEAGCTTHTCTNCGDRYITDETAPLGHAYVSVKTAATCTADGSVVYTCECGEGYTEILPALGHSYEAVVTAPTCTEDGCTTHTCGNCGDSYITDVTAALGHSYTSVEENGSMVYTCSGCGHSYSEKLSFTYSQVSALTSGDRFVITVKSGTKYYALSHRNNGISAVQVTVSGGEITSEITEDLLWSCSDNKLSYVSGGTTYYLYTYSTGWWFWSTPSLGISTSEAGTVSFSSSKLKIGSYYLRYSGSSFTANSSATTAYLFRES